MIKGLSAVLLAAFVAAAITGLPGFAPPGEAGGSQVLAKTDRLPAPGSLCADQHWPHIGPSCLRGLTKADIRPVRIVTADRS